MANLVRLKLIGITYNQIESGVYAVVLQEFDGTRRLPIVIGAAEAQAIECRLQSIKTPRPLTHDLLVNIMKLCRLTLNQVVIRQLPSGVFGANLHMTSDDGSSMIVDSRSSDALALAIRFDCPIYTAEEVLAQSGFQAEEKPRGRTPFKPTKEAEPKTLEQLEWEMQKAVEDENYEEAARLKAEIDRFKKK